jgi:hypothetical protein
MDVSSESAKQKELEASARRRASLTLAAQVGVAAWIAAVTNKELAFSTAFVAQLNTDRVFSYAVSESRSVFIPCIDPIPLKTLYASQDESETGADIVLGWSDNDIPQVCFIQVKTLYESYAQYAFVFGASLQKKKENPEFKDSPKFQKDIKEYNEMNSDGERLVWLKAKPFFDLKYRGDSGKGRYQLAQLAQSKDSIPEVRRVCAMPVNGFLLVISLGSRFPRLPMGLWIPPRE